MNDQIFDALLRDACTELCGQDVANAGLVTPIPHRQHRAVRVLLAAAVLAALFCMSAVAVWPRLYQEYYDGRLYQMVDNAPDHVDPQQMTFNYLPDGYTLEWLDDNQDGQHYQARISYKKAAVSRIGGKSTTMQGSFLVTQSPLRPEMGYHTGEGESSLQDINILRDSVQNITASDLQKGKSVCWVTSEYRYEFVFSYVKGDSYNYNLIPNETPNARNEEILKILRGITP